MQDSRKKSHEDGARGWFTSLDIGRLGRPPAWLERTVSFITVIAIIVSAPATILLLGWILAEFLMALADRTSSFEAARNLGLILAAAFGLPFLVWRSWVGERQARAALRQAQSAEENVATGNFTRAIDHLGAMREMKAVDGPTQTVPNLELRLGALYALERLVQTSERDRGPVAAIISAYLSEHSPAKDNEESVPIPISQSSESGKRLQWLQFRSKVYELNKPRADIQAAVTILCRTFAGNHPENALIEWHRIDAARADLRGGLKPALTMRGAKLFGILGNNVHANAICLTRADLRGANLISANLSNAQLDQARLQGADLEKISLSNASLRHALFNGATITRGNLSQANLERAMFNDCDLTGADLSNALLHYATLHCAFLDRALLTGSIVYGTDFRSAIGLTQEQVDACWEGDLSTRLPEGLHRPCHWPDRIVSPEEIRDRLALHRAGRPPQG